MNGGVAGSGLAAPPALSVPSATGVDARVVLAGPGARAIAFIIDWLIRGGVALVYLLLVSLLITGSIDFEYPSRQRDALVSARRDARDGYLLPLPPGARTPDGGPHARASA